MRKIFVLAAGACLLGAGASGAGAVPTSSLKQALETGEEQIQLVHRGPRACHRVHGRWWRDTRPHSRRCWRLHRHCHRGKCWYH